jgi:hypothetical protein
MGNFLRSLIAEIATSVSLVAFVSAPGARADTPMCEEVTSTIVTCTCECEQDSKYNACVGQAGGTLAPTPNNCPDMLQGRRVLSGGDALLVPDPTKAGAPSDTSMIGQLLLYPTEELTSNPGLGMVDGTPAFSAAPTLPCRPGNGIDIAFPMQSRFARLFNLPYDMQVTLRPSTDSAAIDTDCNGELELVVSSSNGGAPTVGDLPVETTKAQWVQLAIADFDYDGFDDIVLINIDSIETFTAVDTGDPTKGLRSGDYVSTPVSGSYLAPINEPATGDFNGDGLIDVAWIGGDFPNGEGMLSVFFATVCSGAVEGTICEDSDAFDIILNPAEVLFPHVPGATSTIGLADAGLAPNACSVVLSGSAADFAAEGSLRAGAIAVGNFADNGVNPLEVPIDELIVAYVRGDGLTNESCEVYAQYWVFEPPSTSQLGWAVQAGDTQSLLIGTSPDTTGTPATYGVFAQAAYLDWYGTTEQAVIGSVVSRGGYNIQDVTFPGLSEWTPTVVSVSGSGETAEVVACNAVRASDTEAYPYAWGIAAGRFTTYTTVADDNSTACSDFSVAEPGDCPYNPQIAMLLAHDSENNKGNFPPRVSLYSVQASQPGGSDDDLKCANDHSLQGFLPVKYGDYDLESFNAMPPATLRAGSQLRAGDAFGDSVRLGNPTITRLHDHTVPQFIIQVPPSLIDYVQPLSNDSKTPAIVNFTRVPDFYNTTIVFTSGDTEAASTQATRSITSSTTETASGELKFGVPLVATIDTKDKQSWTQYQESNHSQALSTYSTSTLKIGSQVSGDDQLWYQQTASSVFNYPQLGVTNCPSSITCDPTNPGCTGALAGAELACDTFDSGCHCASSLAPLVCPALPSDPTAIECNTDGGAACCSLLPQPLNVSFSGPEQVLGTFAPGAAVEWYQPVHEPGQILSYPSSVGLMLARNSVAKELASLTTFATGVNSASESIDWTCAKTSSVAIGTTTRHSFESDSSITAGTNNIAEATNGAQLSFDFDYQHSDSYSTLNSYTVGMTQSSMVTLNLAGNAFLNSFSYQYDVAAAVLAENKPASVLDDPDLNFCPLDNPDCATDDKVMVDCQPAGPLTVAYAADPTGQDRGSWWKSAATPYLTSIDVALNNPTRWNGSGVGPGQVVNQELQCRGQSGGVMDCYAHNQPPTASASNVWSYPFYSMKGLFVTLGSTTGPLRSTVEVADEVFLQARVYNYSLIGTGSDTNVYARFYRQQLDVNNDNGTLSVMDYAEGAGGAPLPAVPIGPNGLGDTTPVLILAQDGSSHALPGFNNTVDPTNDNIGLATTSYIAADADACEYDSGVQKCCGAYYAYWVTVWAEDGDGNVLPELSGHGLDKSFDPDTIYGFITDVPLEYVPVSATESDTFTNNVGMFKMLVTTVPNPRPATCPTTASLTGPRPGPLSLDRVGVSRDATVLGEPVVVSAQVVNDGDPASGATVVFSDGDPQDGGKTFDAEWLPTIRALDRHFVGVNYNPDSCGPHEIHVQLASSAGVSGGEQVAMVDVGIDYTSAIDYLIDEVRAIDLDFPGNAGAAHKNNLVRELTRAEQALDENRSDKAIHDLEKFTDALARLVGEGRIDQADVDSLISQVQRILGCV